MVNGKFCLSGFTIYHLLFSKDLPFTVYRLPFTIKVLMLQRIQSVFLFLASAAVFSLESLKVNFMTLLHGLPNSGSPYSDNVFNVHDDIILGFLMGFAGTLMFVSIFFFKSRTKQAQIIMLSNFVVGALLIYGTWEARETFSKTVSPETVSGTALQSNFGFAIPALVVALILSWLAIRFINRDEKLVRSADRLR